MYVRLMKRHDVAQVTGIDREAFPEDWPPTNFGRELDNRLAFYIVVCEGVPPPPPEPRPVIPEERLVGLMGRIKQLFTSRETPQIPAEPEGKILGYAGMWILADEAHVMSIASRGEYRRKGVGEALLFALFDLAKQHKARVLTLEVRVSNGVAQNLYTKFGFHHAGVRKGYYINNKEDAVIMTTDYIGTPGLQERLAKLKLSHSRRWGVTIYNIEKLDAKLG